MAINKLSSETNSVLSLIVIMLLFGFMIGRETNQHYYNPRGAVNNIDSIYTEDSVYKVTITIDSVYEVERDQEEPDR